jgi:DNA-binding FrmR family transcriptional regulator
MIAATPEETRRIVNRLRRARGQLDAVVAAVERGDSCRGVVPQLAAATNALHSAGLAIVSAATRDCLEGRPGAAGQAADGLTREELAKLFLRLT